MKKALYIALIFGILFLLFSAQFGYAASARRAVKLGNRLYEEEKFEEALKEYQKAQGKLPDSDIVNFDVGTVLYKKSAYRKAVDSFTKTLITEDKAVEAGANYNIGNAKYRQGSLIENSDLEDAIRLYRESLDYYKRAIELDEQDEDAKFNYDFVKKRLEELIKKQQQEQEKQEEQKKKDEEKDEGQEKDEQKKQEEQKKEEEKKKKEEEEREKEEQRKKEEEQRKQEEQKKQEEENRKKEEEERRKREEEQRKEEQGEKEENPIGMLSSEGGQPLDELTEKQAKLLLEGHRQEEEAQRARRKTIKRAQYRDVLKDW